MDLLRYCLPKIAPMLETADLNAASISFVITIAILAGVTSLFFGFVGEKGHGSDKEPPMIPYWLPYFGHGFSYARDQRGFLEWANKRANGEPFSLLVSGEKCHVFSRPEDVSAIFRKTATLSGTRDGQIAFRQRILGASKLDAEKIADLRADEAKLHATYLLSTDELDKNVVRFVEELNFQLDKLGKDVEGAEVVEERGGKGEGMCTARKDAFAWVGDLMVRTTVASLFGHQAFEEHEGLFEDLRTFLSDKFFWRVEGLPDIFAPTAIRSRKRIQQRLGELVDALARDEIGEDGGACQYITQRVKIMSKLGVSRKGVVANEFDIMLGSTLNSIPMAYITLLHLLCDSDLLEAIYAELKATNYISLSPSARSTLLPTSLPRLYALFREVMRYHTTAMSAREVHETTILNLKAHNTLDTTSATTITQNRTSSSESFNFNFDNKTRAYKLHKGSVISMPSSLLHYNASIHSNPELFDPLRFLSKELGGKGTPVHAGTLRPFGGGGSYCPGRKFAERQVLGLVAGIVGRFEVKLTQKGKVDIPRNADFFYVTACERLEIEISSRNNGS